MPYSSPVFDEEISRIIKFVKPKNLLDIGAGAGKYGLIAKQLDPLIRTVAIEVEKDYIKEFKLGSIYDEVWNISTSSIIQSRYFDLDFDIVVVGDILEHLKKSEGIDLLNFIIYRCRWIIIEFPHRYLQNAIDGHVSEAHISAWSENDFLAFERTKMYMKDTQRFIVLRGYREDEITKKDIDSVVEGIYG